MRHGATTGFDRPIVADIGRAALATALLFATYAAAIKVSYRFLYSPSVAGWGYQELMPRMALLKVAAAMYLSVTAAIPEEFYFRGVLSSIVKKSWAYVLTSGITFGLVHWAHGLHAVVAAVIYGCVAAALFRNFQNRLLPLVAAHFLIGMYWFA